VLKETGFSTFTICYQILNGDDIDSPEDIAPERIPLLKYVSETSCNVEISISACKHILSDRKQSVAPENM
jgi:hypothetical protein